MENKKEVMTGLGIGLGTGLIVGSIIGLLFAPQKGSETRKLVNEKAKVVRDNAGRFAKDIRCKFGKASVDDVRSK